MNDNEQLDRIEKMLRSQMKGAGHLWWIGGYVYGQTSNGDVFVILYPAAENLKEKVVRVYDFDLKKLPAFIPVDGVDAGDTEANPSKEVAKRKGIYHECPSFEICTLDGKETQMGRERRFGDVLRLSKAAREALSGGGRQGQRTPSQQQRPTTAQQQRPSQPPPPEEPLDEGEGLKLPDYRKMAVEAATEVTFDYAAFMALRNGLYTDQERIAATRMALVMGWKPSPKSNVAMLMALETYRDKRAEAEARGEAKSEASLFAKREAQNVYNREIGR